MPRSRALQFREQAYVQPRRKASGQRTCFAAVASVGGEPSRRSENEPDPISMTPFLDPRTGDLAAIWKNTSDMRRLEWLKRVEA